jgi:pimeloyl-ACP methyl ester carboxylesterase
MVAGASETIGTSQNGGPRAAAAWRDLIWWSADGLRLHARVYDGPEHAPNTLPPLLCLPGLTRNARDFDQLAPLLARQRRVYALDWRGRGDSAFARDAMTYVPLTYAQDVVALLDAEGIGRFATVGTSLGGIVTMLLAALLPGRLAGVVLNDVGPELGAAGVARIRGYVGQAAAQRTWIHAAREVASLNSGVYPDWEIEDWLTLIKRTHRLTPEGRIVADYDPNIAQPMRAPAAGAPVDLWPAFAALADVPLLVVRGALSDILLPATAAAMAERAQHMTLVEVPRVGHAPTLDEPEAVTAISAHLAGITA